MKELIYHRGFLSASRYFSGNHFVTDGDYRATYGEHAERVFKLAHALKHQLGLSRGDRFAVLGGTRHEYLELYHAAFLGAGIITPLNTRLAEKELVYIIRDSGSEVVFVDEENRDVLTGILDSLGDDNPVRHVVQIGGDGGQFDFSYEDLLGCGETEIPDETEEDDIAAIMYTGGTTGLPKGVVHTQRSEMLNCYHSAMDMNVFGPESVYLLQTPIFHAASVGAILVAGLFGGSVVMFPRFDPSKSIELIEAHGVTTTNMVPTMIAMVLNAPDFRPERIASLTSLIYGASPMWAKLLDQLLGMFPDLLLVQGYGMTEAGALLTILGPDEHRERRDLMRSVGKPILGIELCIQDPEGRMLDYGEIGEICARGGNYMKGYWNKEEATEEAFRGGWYHTGDAGYMNEEGYLFLVDRVKDMIISGGENVYSVEVENAISSHDSVAQVAVIGIPHDTWGEAVHAVVVPKDGAQVTEAEIIAHARKTIAGYKVPKSVDFRKDPLPLSGVLKVLKRELRAPYWEDNRGPKAGSAD